LKGILLSLGLFVAFPTAVIAQESDAPSRQERYQIDYVLNPDGSHVETRHLEVRILKEAALSWAKQTSVSYSTSVQKAEVIEAYTRKADGRRVDAPKANYQLSVNSGREKDAPAFSDYTSLSVIFPEVAVGDLVVFEYKITQIEPIFPGHFSVMERFPMQVAYDDVKVRVDAPLSLPLRFDVRDLKEARNVEKEGRRIIEWSYSNGKPEKTKRKNWSVYNPESAPGVTISTFRDHADIARAYGARAEPKAAVTDRIRKLAEEITANAKAPRDQARSLYDWVATNITYAGNCVGVGAVVPRDMDFVLDNKMGDCKDHATLLQALLAAKGIRSTQALVNAGSSYDLPKLPVVSMVNHVINYLPDFDLFVDSTSDSTPFGMLPFNSAYKPVLLVDGSRQGARTPALRPGVNHQRVKSVIRIQPDGSAKGEMEFAQKGMFAVSARDRFRSVTPEMEEEMMKSVFSGDGRVGFGKLTKDDPKGLLDVYAYKVAFEKPEFVQLPGAGAFSIAPFFYSEAPIQSLLWEAQQPEQPFDFACTSGVSIEEYKYHFPKNMKVLAVPKNVAVSNATFSYRATYALKGDTLSVTRTVEDRTPGNICTPQSFSEFRKVALKALQDVKAQVVYQ
jgi:transglutaminase-like putative cysteine protease